MKPGTRCECRHAPEVTPEVAPEVNRKPENELSESERWYWIGYDTSERGREIDDVMLYRCPFAFEYAKGYRAHKEIAARNQLLREGAAK